MDLRERILGSRASGITTGAPMTICPIAVVAGCQKCPAFKICPLKTLIGDAPKAKEENLASVKKPVAARKKSKK